LPPWDHALVKAVACELVAETKPPLSRQARADITARAQRAWGTPLRRSTVWRILATAAIKPWRDKYWLLPRAPHCAEQAGPLLDWSAGPWEGAPVGPTDHSRRADEPTSLHARLRCHPARPAAPGRPAPSEHADEGGGARHYLAAWDVRRGYVRGRGERTTGRAPVGRLVHHGWAHAPSRAADRLGWSVDHGASHRGETATPRWPPVDSRLLVVHPPVHASWLTQVELACSIIHRTVRTPQDLTALAAVRRRLAWYERLSNHSPTPVQGKLDRTKLAARLANLAAHRTRLTAAQLHGSKQAA
jgi:hypothetical protein